MIYQKLDDSMINDVIIDISLSVAPVGTALNIVHYIGVEVDELKSEDAIGSASRALDEIDEAIKQLTEARTKLNAWIDESCDKSGMSREDFEIYLD